MVLPVITSLGAYEPVVINVDDQYKPLLSGFDLTYNKSLNGFNMSNVHIEGHVTEHWLSYFDVLPVRQNVTVEFYLPTVVISPDSRSAARRMPVEFWNSIIQYAQFKGLVVTIIGPKDAIKYNSQFELPGVINLTGKQTIQETYSTLKSAIAVVSTDTGTSHLSDALNDVTITAFALNNYDKYAPFWNRRISLNIDSAINHLETLINKRTTIG